MANKLLSDKENEFLTQMKIEAADSENYEQFKNLNLLENYIANLPTTKDRNYAIYKVLNDPRFGFDNPDQWDVSDKSYWSDDNLKDYIPPDVENQLAQKDGENFWNFESKDYWQNRSPNELKRIAEKMGYTNFGAFLNEVGKRDTYNQRNQQLNDKFGKVGSYAVKALYPRMTEKFMEGKDIEGKDLGLDLTEQGLYAFNPTQRVLTSLGKTGKAATLLGNAANPLVMETLDKLAYNGEDTDRANMSPADIGYGTVMNFGMNKAVEKIPGLNKLVAPKEKINTNPLSKESASELKTWADTQENNIKKIEDLIKRNEVEEELPSKLADFFESSNAITNVADRIKRNKKPLQLLDFPTTKDYLKMKTKNAINESTPNIRADALSYASNKAGDLIGENPKARDRFIRLGARDIGGRMGASVITDILNDVGNTNESRERKKKILYELEDLLGSQR